MFAFKQWLIQNFIMGGGQSRERGLAMPPPQKKMIFYLKQVGFGAF